MICVFCGLDRKPSKEHIYPDWLRQCLGAVGKTETVRSEFGVEQAAWPTTGLTWILPRKICRKCNSGWMSRLEDRVKEWICPIALGQRIELSPGVLQVIATWASLKAVLFALRQRPTGLLGSPPQSNLNWLYTHRLSPPKPPPGTQVWIAMIDPASVARSPLAGSNTVTGSPDIDGHMVTIAVGYLVLQVVGQDFREPDNLSPTGQPLASVERPDWLLSFVRAIWPRRADVVRWPLPYRIKGSDWRRLADWQDTGVARVLRVDLPRIG